LRGRTFINPSMMPARLHNLLVLALLFCMGCLGAYLVVRATPYGLGLRDDSFRYLSAAESLAAGDGYGRWDADGVFHSLTNFPPLYSAFLAVSERLGISAYRGARAMSIVASASLIFLVGVYLYFRTTSVVVALFGASFVAFSASMITTYVWVLSEPLSNLLIMMVLINLVEFLEHPHSRWLMMSLILLSALAFLTRYANLSLAVTAVISLVFLPAQPIRKRFAKSTFYIVLSMLPLAGFLLRNVLVAGSLANRPTPFFHPPDTAVVQQGVNSIMQWILPRTVTQNLNQVWANLLVLTLIGVITVGWYVGFIRKSFSQIRGEQHAVSRIVSVFWIFFITYLGLILGTLFWFDRLLPLNERILSPLFLAGLFIILSPVLTVAQGRSRSLSIMLIGISAILLVANARDALSYVEVLHQDGLGYASTEWRTSRTMKFIKDLPEVPIYSNDIPAAYLLADRIVHSLPITMNPSTFQINPNYQSEMDQMRFDLLNEDGYIVLIGSDPLHRVEADALSTFTEGLDLEVLFPDGAVFHAGN